MLLTFYLRRMYLIWLDKPQDWVFPIKTIKYFHNRLCSQTVSFRGTAPTFVLPHYCRILSAETLKYDGVFTANIERRDPCQRIFDACQSINDRAGTFDRVRPSIFKSVHVYIDSGGWYFEHLLWIVTWPTIRNQQSWNLKRALWMYYTSCE